jgi:hypothetical protein
MPDSAHIQQRAYEIWEREGRPEGQHQAHWDQAEREVAAEGSPAPNTADITAPQSKEAALAEPVTADKPKKPKKASSKAEAKTKAKDAPKASDKRKR